MEGTLFGVRVHRFDNIGYTAVIVNVHASNKHSALDKVKNCDEYELCDEEIQRAIVDSEIPEHRVERKYSDYIFEQKVIE